MALQTSYRNVSQGPTPSQVFSAEREGWILVGQGWARAGLGCRLHVGVAGQRAAAGPSAAGRRAGFGVCNLLPFEHVHRVAVGFGWGPGHREAGLALAGGAQLIRPRPVLAITIVLDGRRECGLWPVDVHCVNAAAARAAGGRLAAAATALSAPGREAERQREAAQQQQAAAQVAQHQAVADLHRDRAGLGRQDGAICQEVVVPGDWDEAQEARGEEHDAGEAGQHEVGLVPPAAHAESRQQQPQARDGQRRDHQSPRHAHRLGGEVAEVVRLAALALATALLAAHVPQALVQHQVQRLVKEALHQPPARRQRAGQGE